MEKIAGKVKGSFVFVHNDYVYNKDHRSENIYRCNTRRTTRCCGSVMVLSDGTITLLKPHNHPGQEYTVTQHFMVEEMMKLSRETLIPFKQIFDDVCRKHPDAAAYCSFSKLRPTLHRQRANFKPTIPQSLEILYDQMKTYQPLEKLKVPIVKSLKDEFAVIITTDGLLEGLKNSKEIFVDGTFAVLPKKPHMGQLYTIHIRYMDNGIATILVLCETRTAALYTAIWKKIFNLIPELANNIRFIMSDYEAAAVTTLNELFPNAHIHGCWFHYCQAILRKWRKLGLTNVPNTVVRMSMSLALVPETKFQEALLIIQKEADNIASNFPNVLLFMTYMRINWLKMASQVSVYNCPVRTNNIAESFHNVAGQKLGKQNINVWSFLEKIRDLLIDQELDLNRLQNGVTSRKPRTRENISRGKKIAKAQAELDTGRLFLEEFLNIFQHKDTIFKINKISALADEDINDEIADANSFDKTTYNPTEADKPEWMHAKTLPGTTSASSNSSTIQDGTVSAGDYIVEILNDSFWECEKGDTNDQEDSNNHKSGFCIICFINKATEVCVPCGHLACCITCISQCDCKRCPICNVSFTMYVTLRKPEI